MSRSVEVQVTVVCNLKDEDDPNAEAERILNNVRGVSEDFGCRVDLNTVTLREGRKVLQRFGYKRR